MKRKNTQTGARFTVRGQTYVQIGAFFHALSNDREVRVLELETTCPECADLFQTTASMRQITTRQLIRRCPSCRKTHSGPVAAPPVQVQVQARKTVRAAHPWPETRKGAAPADRRAAKGWRVDASLRPLQR